MRLTERLDDGDKCIDALDDAICERQGTKEIESSKEYDKVEVNKGGYSEASFDIKEVYNNDGFDHAIITTGDIGEQMIRHMPELIQAARDVINDPNPEKYKNLERWVKQYETGW